MNKLSVVLGAGALLALAVGCGKPVDGYGDLSVDYAFQGVESPEKVTIFVIEETEGLTCDTLAYQPDTGIWDTNRNLPITGTTEFNDLPNTSLYIVLGIGTKNNGVRVADDCKDGVRIRNEKWTDVELELENVPLNMGGKYFSDMELDFQAPSELINVLVAFDVACQALDLNEDACVISNAVGNMLTDLDVTALWEMDQRYDAVRGDMKWITVEGKDVGPEWKLVEGGFNGEIPGATEITMISNDMKVHLDQVVLFLISEVMGYDLNDFGDQVELVMESWVSDLEIHDGSAAVVDNDFDGIAEAMYGAMDAEIKFEQVEYVHEMTMDWYADRD